MVGWSEGCRDVPSLRGLSQSLWARVLGTLCWSGEAGVLPKDLQGQILWRHDLPFPSCSRGSDGRVWALLLGHGGVVSRLPFLMGGYEEREPT